MGAKIKMRRGVTLASCAALGAMLGDGWVHVGENEAALIVSKVTGVSPHVRGPGVHVKMPFLARAEVFDTGPERKMVEPVAVTTSDGITLTAVVDVESRWDGLHTLPSVYSQMGIGRAKPHRGLVCESC